MPSLQQQLLQLGVVVMGAGTRGRRASALACSGLDKTLHDIVPTCIMKDGAFTSLSTSSFRSCQQ